MLKEGWFWQTAWIGCNKNTKSIRCLNYPHWLGPSLSLLAKTEQVFLLILLLLLLKLQRLASKYRSWFGICLWTSITKNSSNQNKQILLIPLEKVKVLHARLQLSSRTLWRKELIGHTSISLELQAQIRFQLALEQNCSFISLQNAANDLIQFISKII